MRRLILTNLNPSVYTRRYVSTFLTELAVNSLLYEEVLIREGDLICNRNITTLLKDPLAASTFEELLACGAVRVLRLPASALSEAAFDPKKKPMSARADDHQRRRSYQGRRWQPLAWEWDVYERLDAVLGTHPAAYRTQKKFPRHNDFAATLREVLEHRDQYRLRRHRPFQNIDDGIAEAFIEFCAEPGAWRQFLERKGLTDPILGPEGDFYRTAAYQCAAFFENPSGMRRLVESVYAACECDRETAEGRYGRGQLAELPYRYNSLDEEHAGLNLVTRLGLESHPSAIHFGVEPGLGEVLASVREHSAFRAMQEALDQMTSVPNPEHHFRSAWSALAELTADKLARRMTRSSRIDTTLTQLAVGLYTGARVFGYVVLHAHHHIDWSVLADGMAIKRIEHWVPALSRCVRAGLRLPKVYEQWTHAATLRCETVAARQ